MKRSVDPAVAAFNRPAADRRAVPAQPCGGPKSVTDCGGYLRVVATVKIEADFASRILAFDDACAVGYATVRTARALIGGMALAHGTMLATRNIADFE